MFWKELKRHKLDYSILLFGLAVILFSFVQGSADHSWQQGSILTLGIFYTAWGIWHHSREKSFQISTALEYFGMSVFICLILWFALTY